MSSLNSKGPRIPMSVYFHRWPPLPHAPHRQPSPLLLLSHPKGGSRQHRGNTRQDLACFFSGDYLSACDLSTALSRLTPAVVRGDIKPKLARTIAYMFQTLTQSIHISQKEYANAYGTEGWRKAVRNSVNSNYDYRFPPGPGAEQPASPQPTEPQTQGPTSAPQRPAPAPASQPPRLQSRTATPTAHTAASSSHASSPANQSTVTNTHSYRPASAPAQSAEPAASPAVQTPQAAPPQPTAVDAALSVARSVFRRHPTPPPLTPLEPTFTQP